MRHPAIRWILTLSLLAAPALAHDKMLSCPIVIDTDMGLDDAVTLALALQHPGLNVTAIVACDGVASGETCTAYLERMLERFNRRDIALYAPAPVAAAKTPPPFRAFAERAVGAALPPPIERFRRPFSPDAYISDAGQTVVLVLGPMSNLAAALRARPELRSGISEVFIAGAPDAKKSWNAAFDPEALTTLWDAHLELEFVIAANAGRKPDSWQDGDLALGPDTSVGESFFRQLMAEPDVRRHYLTKFASFHDELIILYAVAPELFSKPTPAGIVIPHDSAANARLFTRLLSAGRQKMERVIFVKERLPDAIFQDDIRRRRARIIAKNGETEWFAQLLMNEMHEHLGAYSVIGVKMGLRAAELLNAPQHSMQITSRVAAVPPVSCFNDGVIVSTGSTPGRALFKHEPGPPGTVEVTFAYNGRKLTLRLKDEYRLKIRNRIAGLLETYTLADEEYWTGVRELGLIIWENWHRRDLFEAGIASGASSN